MRPPPAYTLEIKPRSNALWRRAIRRLGSWLESLADLIDLKTSKGN
jgi:hypothetical protein